MGLLTRIRDERGATAAIVAIVIVVLFAMIVLVIDVGGLLLRRRGMVNASDAGALAAAKSCAVVTDTTDPEFQSDLFAADNVVGLPTAGANIISIANCDTNSGHVTVDYTSSQDLIFAGVLGFNPTSPVNTQATAIWGPAGGGNPQPIVLNVGTFQGACRIPDADQDGGPLDIGDRCYFWYDNDRFDGSNFGFMNLGQWDVSAGFSCSSAGASDRRDWIIDGWDGGDQLTLNYPDGPTYVCTDSGISASNWQTLESEIGQIKFFPMNDWDGSITGFPELYGGAGQIDKYNIIGFSALQIEDLLTVSEAAGTGGSCNNSFEPFDSNGDVVGGQVFSVDAFGSFNGCFGAAPDNITGFDIDPSHGSIPDFVPCPTSTSSGCDYFFDPGTRNVTWLGAPTQAAGQNENRDDLQLSFDWSNDGICGPAPNNASARCLVVSWQGDTVTGTAPNLGWDFGVRAIKLCDFDIAGSCTVPTGP
jgi:hypothetical protein